MSSKPLHVPPDIYKTEGTEITAKSQDKTYTLLVRAIPAVRNPRDINKNKLIIKEPEHDLRKLSRRLQNISNEEFLLILIN